MLRQELADKVHAALDRLIASGELPEAARVDFEILDTKSPEHGDYATNLALIASKPAGMNPRQIGEKLQKELVVDEAFTAVDLAGPGFLNFKLKPEVISEYVQQILDLSETLPSAMPEGRNAAATKKLEVEYVSVNPNGPITVGSGRGAAFGDTLCNILAAAGNEVDREFYINDGVNSEQMRLFAESVRHYVWEATGTDSQLPEKGYKGDYVSEVAKRVLELHGRSAAEQPTSWFQSVSQQLMIERQREGLSLFGVNFDIWFSEQSMHDSGKVKGALKFLEEQGAAYRAAKPVDADDDIQDEGANEEAAFPQEELNEALWLRSSEMGDEKDRVLVRADGRPTYISADVAYLKEKFDRGYDKCFMILGPDHHGYIGRMYAVCKALGREPIRDFEIVIFQIVRFVKDGKPAPMRKRDGNIYELKDLIEELGQAVAPQAPKEEQQRIGADVARFFYLMRSHDTHMDFDIDLATKQSDENPVFYVQYAHARISSVLKKAEEALTGRHEALGSEGDLNAPRSTLNASLLTHPRELALIKKILDLPEEVQRAARDYGVHRVATYAIELARSFHHFYDACRVIQPEEPELTQARLALVRAAQIGLKSALNLLGVSAPERMERASDATAASASA